MTTAGRELEYKLRATTTLAPDAIESALRMALAELGAVAAPAAAMPHVDTYLDDEQRTLLRHGIGLRLRRGGDRAVVCCKERGARDGALFDRRELEQPWIGSSAPTSARDLPQALCDAVEPLVRGRALQTIVQLEVHREARQLACHGVPLAEFAVDRVTANGRGRQVAFCELELEVRGDAGRCAVVAEQLRRQLPVEAAAEDKLAWSLAQLALVPAVFPQEQVPATLGGFLVERLQRRLELLGTTEAAVRCGGAPAEVHDLRVELRRARTLVRAFRAAWPTELVAAAELSLARAAHGLAALRNLDVHTARIADLLPQLPRELATARELLDADLAAMRTTMLQRVHEFLRAESHAIDLAQLDRLADATVMVPELADLPADAALLRVRKTAKSTRDRMRELAGTPALEEVHALRLALKRLRILAGECEGLGLELRGRLRRRLARASDQLGVACDCAALAAFCLQRLDQTEPAPLVPRHAALLAAIATHESLAVPGAILSAQRALRRLDRKRLWRALRKACS